MTVRALHCRTALIDGAAVPNVRLRVDDGGRIARVDRGVAPRAGDLTLGFVLPGSANAHSHAFHRVMRGRTHDSGGDFWHWRRQMYAAAGRLDPDRYHDLALGVFGEMLVAGWTAVGEFHYLHHRADGTNYLPVHAMELALAEAARTVGIRLTLLDTCYLTGGFGRPLAAEQRRFADGTAARWLDRWSSLHDSLPEGTVLGAAIHSVRSVPPEAIREIVRSLPAEVPLHVHLSEQPLENEECLRAYGLTPTHLLARAGALSPRLSAIHATHLTDDDVRMLGDAGTTVVICPTTEADLGDGIGPARRLADAGAVIALGSDQHAVVDPFLEARGIEAGERLASGSRGRFEPAALTDALTINGYGSLGQAGGIREAALCDLVEIDRSSVRTAGADPGQIVLVATASDVRRVIVGGAVRADTGTLTRTVGADRTADPGWLLADALASFPLGEPEA